VQGTELLSDEVPYDDADKFPRAVLPVMRRAMYVRCLDIQNVKV
jgi:hypothetical protein